MNSTNQPLVSILSFCKDRASTIRRSIDSVVGQSYRRLEFVVQDGVSTDGTIDILRSYEDGRIKLVSEPDSGPAEAFWKVLSRCQGDIIGTCLSDEELLPDAVAQAVEIFQANPGLGAATCDGYITDSTGKETGTFVAGEFDFVSYLFGRYCPFWPGTFFRRQALVDVGLEDHDWAIDALEFEVWCRLGTRHHVKYFPMFMSKYTIQADQLSNTPKNFNEHMNGRLGIIERMFSADGFAGADRATQLACLYNQYFLFYNHARAYKIFDQMEAIYLRMMPLLKELDPAEWQKQCAVPFSEAIHGLSAPPIPSTLYDRFANLYQARGQIQQALEMRERAETASGCLLGATE
jgi:glycosyltransferase involved in cell wall biosynthesis